ATEAKPRRLVLADEIDFALLGNLAVHAQAPVAGVHQQPPQAFAAEVLAGPHRGAEGAGRFARGGFVGLRPGDRHHRVVLLAFDHEYFAYFLPDLMLKACVAVRSPMIGRPDSMYSTKCCIWWSGRSRKRVKIMSKSAVFRASRPGMLLTLGLIVPSLGSIAKS